MMTERKRLLLISLLVTLFCCTTCVEGACDPDCTGLPAGNKTADPYDCTQFYVCADETTPSDIPYKCPDGEIFDPVESTCSSTAECTLACGFCHLTCNTSAPVDFVADPGDCSIYYICGPSGPTLAQVCPGSAPYFNSNTKTCDSNPDVCCKPSCTPYCEVNDNMKVPDPKDCKRYYLCTESTPYPVFSCPAGEHFDVGRGECGPNVDCVILCPNEDSKPSPLEKAISQARLRRS